MTWHIHIRGQVQGVGFRPFVWRLATEQQLAGWVNNAADGLHIEIEADAAQARHFLGQVLMKAPAQAHITHSSLTETAPGHYQGFEIVHSDTGFAPKLLITPDFALCKDCRTELYTADNPRFHYPFITCTSCGPRFSISTQLPYDRERTSMSAFRMCARCEDEYRSVSDRRFFSQTNSCPDCGISLKLYLSGEGQQAREAGAMQLIRQSAELLRRGQILALKGIGGFLLLCDATSAEAIATLRQRKNRPSKPLAVLYPSVEAIAGDAETDPASLRLLEGSAAPLVLLPLKEKTASGICTELLAPGLDHIGVMLPYAPLLDLLAREVGHPLVATSGNMSGSPIFFTDAQALKHLGQVADAFLTHNRDIVLPQDDSVIHIADNHPIILRRSRGLAPTFFTPQTNTAPQGSVLALGAQQKSTFCWQQGNNVYISPYLGDMDSADTQERFDYVLRHFEQLLDTRPQQVLADTHPGYYTSELAQELSARWQIPLLQVQHHKAHAAAVLGEHGLNRSEKPVMAVVWDGTGLGEDGQIWGGEFFICEQGQIRRFAHLGYFDALLGDKMPREPRLSALSLCKELPEGHNLLKPHFSLQAWDLYQRMLAQPGGLKTSSMGRFFDGVACLLGLPAQVSFEGEAAMQLEALARRGFRKGAIPEGLTGSYLGDKLPLSGAETAPAHILRPLLAHLLAGGDRAEIAARFHLSLVQLIRDVARQSACTEIAFSGGVFQNALLISLINKHLGAEFTLHFHQQLSPNDENISYGQLQYSTHYL